MVFLTYKQKYPDNPTVKIYKRPLSDIAFPITLKFCITDLGEKPAAKYQKYGYSNVWPFFLGQGRHGGNIFGWNGHTKNGSTIGTVQGTTQKGLYEKKSLTHKFLEVLNGTSFDWEGITEKIVLYKPNGEV